MERLRFAGYKVTPARRAVLQVVENEHAHLNPADVWKRGQQIYPALGRATVYRTLEILTRIGVLRPIYAESGSTCYIRIEGGHHHLICKDCGAVIEFDECISDDLATVLEDRFSFEIHSHLLEFYGSCQNCRPSRPS